SSTGRWCSRPTTWKSSRSAIARATCSASASRWRSTDAGMIGGSWLPRAAVLAACVRGAVALPRFDAVQPELFAAGTTLVNAAADYDGDGDLDLFVGFNGTPNRLYRNDEGVFTAVAAAAGVGDARGTRAAAWGDFDADGDADLLVGFAPGAGTVLRLYRNERGPSTKLRAGLFTDVTDATGVAIAT